jgi:hypothetical protein
VYYATQKKYVLYVAFEGKVPTENTGTGNGIEYYEVKSDSESYTEEMNATMYYEDYGRSANFSRGGTMSKYMCKSIHNLKNDI